MPENPAVPALCSLQEAIEAIAACCDDGDVWARYSWIYAETGKPLIQCRFYLSPDEDEMQDNDYGEEVSAYAHVHGLYGFLEPATFASVLCVQKEQNPLSHVQDYADALEYYAEYDTFCEVKTPTSKGDRVPSDLSRGFFTEYDLHLVECPDEQVISAARATAALLAINVAEALKRCRQLPVLLGERVDAHRRDALIERFAALSLPLCQTTYRPLIWLPQEPDRAGLRASSQEA
ncbi:hypothetical protein [Pseudomonas purpurea]|uniref:hypothetical protein n=1 Tax=Pseudomonas purpurea TaxID=3136737 RepID=UPI0032639B52